MKIVAVTPAGRQAYLELLARRILADATIDEWQLWDNCRFDRDRAFLEVLAARHSKVRIVPSAGAVRGNGAINAFYSRCADVDAFYIKLDDDIVWLPNHFGAALHHRAAAERDRFSWWSPIVVNNAICSWLMQNRGRLVAGARLSALADDATGWRSAAFAAALLAAFIEAAASGRLDRFATPDAIVSLARFSINCIGFFGAEAARLGADFCPVGVDDEDWISAVVPVMTGRPGRILGDLVVCHFAYYVQENELLAQGLLDRFYALAGLVRQVPLPYRPRSVRSRLAARLRPAPPPVEIGWRERPSAPALHAVGEAPI